MKNRILIADDEADIGLILKLHLEDAGYSTVRARDGVEALDLLAREQFELLLLDIKMPRMDGLQVLKVVRETYPAMVVVMMTAHGSEEIAVRAMKEGAMDYIAKPFSSDDMLKRVERAILYNRTLQANQLLQEQLVAEQKKTEAILQGMAELLVAVNTNGEIISVNRKVEDLLGRKRDEILGLPLETVLVAELPDDERLPSRRTLASGEPVLDATYMLQTVGGKIPVLASAAPLHDKTGTLIGCVEVIRDITSLKELEREREDFVSMLSHDLKNPITAIVGSLDLVREGRLGPINDEQREFIESAEESCAEMVEMINSLLDIHKFEAGRMVMNFKPEKVRHLIDKLVAQYSRATEKNGIRLSVQIAEDLPECRLDRTTFIRMMANLLSNALKFTPEGGAIDIAVAVTENPGEVTATIPQNLYPAMMIPSSGSYIQVSVTDNGVGMATESLGLIFDRFVQANNRRLGRIKGTGLGLAFCRKVMDAHNGLIWAESAPGQGSRFIALFPFTAQPLE